MTFVNEEPPLTLDVAIDVGDRRGLVGNEGHVRRHVGGRVGAGLPGDVAVAAQRIAREALSNAARHSRGTQIRVSLAAAAEALTVEVSDDGSGDVAPRPGGVGLDSMRRRAEAVGGLLRLAAVPGVGTRVVATLPLGTT